MVGFASHCALRNAGARVTDLVEVRNGLSFDGSLPYHGGLIPAAYEKARDILVNGETFRKPVTLQPGSAVVVDATFSFPVEAAVSPHLLEQLQKRTLEKPIATTLDLVFCMRKIKLEWTDYMGGFGRMASSPMCPTPTGSERTSICLIRPRSLQNCRF